MATVFESSASHGVRKRLRSDLPLVACGKCKQKNVVEYKVKEGPNQGRIFYTCPDRKWDGTGTCSGWYWAKDYAKHVKETLAKATEATNESAPVYDDEPAVNQ